MYILVLFQHIPSQNVSKWRMESLKMKKLHGVLKASGIMLCISGVIILAFYKGTVLDSINHHHLLHNKKTVTQAANSSKMRWILGTFITTLSIFLWALWTVLMVSKSSWGFMTHWCMLNQFCSPNLLKITILSADLLIKQCNLCLLFIIKHKVINICKIKCQIMTKILQPELLLELNISIIQIC